LERPALERRRPRALRVMAPPAMAVMVGMTAAAVVPVEAPPTAKSGTDRPAVAELTSSKALVTARAERRAKIAMKALHFCDVMFLPWLVFSGTLKRE